MFFAFSMGCKCCVFQFFVNLVEIALMLLLLLISRANRNVCKQTSKLRDIYFYHDLLRIQRYLCSLGESLEKCGGG